MTERYKWPVNVSDQSSDIKDEIHSLQCMQLYAILLAPRYLELNTNSRFRVYVAEQQGSFACHRLG